MCTNFNIGFTQFWLIYEVVFHTDCPSYDDSTLHSVYPCQSGMYCDVVCSPCMLKHSGPIITLGLFLAMFPHIPSSIVVLCVVAGATVSSSSAL